jgi:hypothetical protein
MTHYKKAVGILLDQHTGRPDYCQTLRNTISTTLDPTRGCPISLDGVDIDNLIKDNACEDSYSHKSSAMEMYTFDQPNDCVQYMQKNKGKRFFLIMPSALGEHFVPQILKNDPKMLQKSVDYQHGSVYVLCNNVINVERWVSDCKDYVQIFAHETSLLAQLARDVGEFFVSLGQEQYAYKTPAFIRRSIKYFNWAKNLFIQASEIEKDSIMDNKRKLNIDSKIVEAESLLQQISDNDDGIDQCILRDEATDEDDVEMHEFHHEDELNISSSALSTGQTGATSSHILAESVSTISSDDIKEKMPAETDELMDESQNSSDIGVFLQLPLVQTKNFENIHLLLKQLFNTDLRVVVEEQEYLKRFNTVELAIIVLVLSTDDDQLILAKLCTLHPSPLIYLLGLQPETTNDKEEFFTKYPQVCAMSNNPEELAVKVALDVALKYRIKGDCYARNKERDRANQMYDQYIELLNRLGVLAKNNM